MYHALESSRSVVATDPSWFAETMAALAEAGYRTVDLPAWIAQGRPEVERGFALTFDDGYRSVLAAADVLPRYGFGATIFLVTGRMGDDNRWAGQPRRIPTSRLLDWSDLPPLQAAGFQFGAHSRTHPRLDRLGGDVLDAELRGSRDDIEQRLGVPCRLLAYPYGHGPPLVRRAAARHFDAAFTTRLATAMRGEDPYGISRIDAYYLRSPRWLSAFLTDRRRFLAMRRLLRAARQGGRLLAIANRSG
ncbi:MAG: polysaccharide deacetylase family protein [Isosphaeraceae bacterium]|nr:polysaccharide deacetylase family protein [Isosphaeraceae bacterium]